MMFALGSMMAIVFVCFARHLTDWALPLMVISWTLYLQFDYDKWCETSQEIACKCRTFRLLWLLRRSLAALAPNPMRLPELHCSWSTGSCRGCDDWAVTTQPENKQSESRRGFLPRDEEDPCDRGGRHLVSLLQVTLGTTIGILGFWVYLYSVYWFKPYLSHMSLVPVHTPHRL